MSAMELAAAILNDAATWCGVGLAAYGVWRGVEEYRKAQQWKASEFLAMEMEKFFSDQHVRTALILLDYAPVRLDRSGRYTSEGEGCSVTDASRARMPCYDARPMCMTGRRTMRFVMWTALLWGCAVEDPLDTAEPSMPPIEDTGERHMVMSFTVDCSELEPPDDIREISWLPLFEHVHRVYVPFDGYLYREDRPPADAVMRLQLSDDFAAWVKKSGAKPPLEPERHTRDIRISEEGRLLAPCEYLATCRQEPCADDDLWLPDGTPNYDKLVGWIYAPIELTVWER